MSTAFILLIVFPSVWAAVHIWGVSKGLLVVAHISSKRSYLHLHILFSVLGGVACFLVGQVVAKTYGTFWGFVALVVLKHIATFAMTWYLVGWSCLKEQFFFAPLGLVKRLWQAMRALPPDAPVKTFLSAMVAEIRSKSAIGDQSP